MPKQYEVIEAVHHDGRLASPGSKLELEEVQAQSLLELGKIKELGGQRESTLPPSIPASNVTTTLESDLLQSLPNRAEREAALGILFATEGWKPIQAIAQVHGISKPSSGWDAAIPLILEKEFPPDNTPPLAIQP